MKLYLIVYTNIFTGESDWFFKTSGEYLPNDTAKEIAVNYLVDEWEMTKEEARQEVGEVYVNTVDQVDGYTVTLERTK